MPDSSPAKLPTEFITEKTLLTLGGTSLIVLLICWLLSYLAADVSWMNYKFYRVLAFALSEIIAVYMLFKTGKKQILNWIIALINGAQIFANASGLNGMMSSSMFNATNQTKQAGLFALPHLSNWWPDEKLIEENKQLFAKNNSLDSLNKELQKKKNKPPVAVVSPSEIQVQLPSVSQQNELKEKQQQIDDLRKQLDQLQHPTLSDLLTKVCEINSSIPDLRTGKISRQLLYDDTLRNESFYKEMNWGEFCKSFSAWKGKKK